MSCAPLWHPRAVAEMHKVMLSDWQAFEVKMTEKDARTRHFAGSNGRDGHGRVNSAVLAFDARTRTGVTVSGRVCRLQRSSGINLDAEYVWKCRMEFNPATDIVEVSATVREHTSENP